MIQTSSTAGSSRNGWSGPKPDTRATSSPTIASTSADRSDDPGQAALVVGAHHGLGEAAYDERVALRVDALAAHGLAHPLVERLDQVGVRVRGDDRQRRSLPSKRSVSETYDRGGLLGKGPARICG